VTKNQSTNSAHEPGTRLISATVLEICLRTSDADIIREACHWSSGDRGEARPPDEILGLDLPFAIPALRLSADVLPYAADASGVGLLASRVSQLTEQAEAAGTALAQSVGEAASTAADTTAKAARSASEETAKTVAETVKKFHADASLTLDSRVELLGGRLDRLLAGENSDVATTIRTLVANAMSETQTQWSASFTTMLGEMNRSLDMSNPANPIGALARQLDDSQRRHNEIVSSKLDRVTELVASAAGAASTAEAAAAVFAASPAKGIPYEDAVAEELEVIANEIGGSYEQTGMTIGLIRNCRKGDAVIELPMIHAGETPPRILIEATTQRSRRDWPAYFRQAEPNRGCQVSLGIVPSVDGVPGGDLVAMLGSSRAVVAFDPAADSPGLVRALIQMLAIEARRRLVSHGDADLELVDRKLSQARTQLAELIQLQKVATGVRDNASKVVAGLDSVRNALAQTLDQAIAALPKQASAVAA
jgi:hypothetical protein